MIVFYRTGNQIMIPLVGRIIKGRIMTFEWAIEKGTFRLMSIHLQPSGNKRSQFNFVLRLLIQDEILSAQFNVHTTRFLSESSTDENGRKTGMNNI